MRNDRQNVGKHDQEAGNVYITHPASRLRLSSPVRCQSFVIRHPSSSVSRPSSVVRRLSFAFTLVELMVVVAVISILLMLLVPNIRTMREKAWTSNCQNNLRQYGIAMNQYMADYGGYFIYPGFGVGGAQYLAGGDVGDFSVYDNRAVPGATVGGAAQDYWGNFISRYLGTNVNVTLAGLSAGEPSIRVCPVILRELHNVNYFDPGLEGKGFKGYGEYYDAYTQTKREFGDFENSAGAGYDDGGELSSDYALTYLDTAFTTYAINPMKYRQVSSNCPASVIAFIDWNARDGWYANLYGRTWAWSYNESCFISVSNYFMFKGTSAAGSAVDKNTPKWTNAWWLTEVGFHHLGQGGVYGANYVAMDGHVGWIGSNAISITNFTGL